MDQLETRWTITDIQFEYRNQWFIFDNQDGMYAG